MLHMLLDQSSLVLSSHSPTMKNFLPLPLLLALAVAAVVSPLRATAFIMCGGDGRSYRANSTYKANLRRLAAVLPAEASSSQDLYAYRSVGYFPNRVQGAARCLRYGGDSASSCDACIARAFGEVETECNYLKEAFFFDETCSLDLDGFRIWGGSTFRINDLLQSLASGMVFQAFGFAWLFFLFLREWCDRKRNSPMRPSSLPLAVQ